LETVWVIINAMPRRAASRWAASGLALSLSLVAAGCGPAKPPVAVAPPPPPVVAPPARPVPPANAMLAMTIPPMRADGQRDTPNKGLGPDEMIWNFRSAFNVAALNCQGPQHFRLADDYNTFLKVHKRELDRANKAVEDKYRREYGANYKRIRDTESTQVYNFFALPPVKSDFCNAALVLGPEAAAIPSSELKDFAARALPQLDGVFDRFFLSYEQYQSDLAQWIAQYGGPESQTSLSPASATTLPASGGGTPGPSGR